MEEEIKKNILKRLSYYYGKTQTELKQTFSVDSAAKNINEVLLTKMLGIDGKLSSSEELKESNIKPKTVRILKNGHVKESMSFPTFKFTEIIHQTWEESNFYQTLNSALFMFVIFVECEDGDFIFSRVKFWRMTERDLFEARKAWEKTVQIIRDGVELVFDGKVTRNNLPSSADNPVAHVRPHAQNSLDTYPLPDGRTMPKQCFWLNRSYIEKIVTDNDNDLTKVQERLSEGEIITIRNTLNDSDIVYISDIENKFIEKYGKEHIDRISAKSFKELGYIYCSDYVINSKFGTPEQYYSYLILNSNVLDINAIDTRLIQSISFNKVLNQYRSNIDILEFEEGKYITLEHLCNIDSNISKDTIVSFASEALEFSGANEYLNSKHLRDIGFNNQLYDLGFSDFFYDSILRYSGIFKYMYIGGKLVFYKMSALKSKSNGEFIKDLIKGARKMEVERIKDDLQQSYGISLPSNKIITLAKNYGLFYESTMEKIYLTKEDFYDEL